VPRNPSVNRTKWQLCRNKTVWYRYEVYWHFLATAHKYPTLPIVNRQRLRSASSHEVSV